ncbi:MULTISPECIES: helix-turn-helix transcriptional regulator [Streptomyces]|uniref:helix-turn-helix transcriptional regulator n=1 Tax=Streptomyces TaxID=1883 RepID=UPI00224992D9|nr:hypothetical protein [Streptomyces sp. JHD 1]MCX2971393.1 hypothetical protein [Streptomyces sp. JHD 1]
MTTSGHPRQLTAANTCVQALQYHAGQVGEIARLLNGPGAQGRPKPLADSALTTVRQLLEQVPRRPVASRISLDVLPSGTASGLLDVLHRLLLENPRETRLLVSRSAWDEDTGRPPTQTHAAAAVRVAGPQIHGMTLIDGTVALLGSSTARLTVVRDRRTVRALESLFDTAWEGAVDFDVLAGVDGELVRAVEEDGPLAKVLALLRAGWTDAAAARELGWSVRTYRRRVADLKSRLRARSRFEAGMRAAQLRLEHHEA